ncbi:MAG: UDP-glucose 4-epimerase GalE [Cyclobacteriaceae bacterium]
MESKKILVTGGAGYIGSHTVVQLHEAGYTPIILDDFSNSDRKVIQGIGRIIGTEVKWYECDCRDREYLEKIFILEKNIEGVIHFAASKAVGESVADPLKYYDNNLGSLITLMKVMDKSKVNKMVFSSSCTVYGQATNLPVTEESPILPAESPYGFTKQVSEEIIKDVAKSNPNFRAISLRYFNPVGAHPTSHIGELPNGVPSNLVPFITQTAAGIRDEVTVFGNDYSTPDGFCIRDYIHVVDLGNAHVKALEFLKKAKENYQVINCGTGKGNSVMEVIKAFEEVTNQQLKYRVGPRRPGDVEAIYADTSKANKLLQWETQLTLEQALEDAWDWQKKIS